MKRISPPLISSSPSTSTEPSVCVSESGDGTRSVGVGPINRGNPKPCTENSLSSKISNVVCIPFILLNHLFSLFIN